MSKWTNSETETVEKDSAQRMEESRKQKYIQIQLQLLMLEDLLHMGAIDQDLFNRAVQKLKKKRKSGSG